MNSSNVRPNTNEDLREAAAWRALWSFVSDAIIAQPVPENVIVSAAVLGGLSFRHFAEAFRNGLVKIAPLYIADELVVRVLVAGDDEWIGLTHPPAWALGLGPGHPLYDQLAASAEKYFAPDDLSGLDGAA